MDNSTKISLRKKLENLKKEYQTLINDLEQGLEKPLADTTAELSLYDNHPADVASEVFERGKDIGSKIYVQQQLEKVEDALRRLEEGTYGFCDKCGRPIPLERLKVVPFTTMCVDCREEEGEDGVKYNVKVRRSIEEQVIMPPFGDLTNDNVNEQFSKGIIKKMFDGEDAWQNMARFGTSETPSDIGNVLDYDHMYLDYDEDVGNIERYEQIPIYKDKDGQFYENLSGLDDEGKTPETYDQE